GERGYLTLDLQGTMAFAGAGWRRGARWVFGGRQKRAALAAGYQPVPRRPRGRRPVWLGESPAAPRPRQRAEARRPAAREVVRDRASSSAPFGSPRPGSGPPGRAPPSSPGGVAGDGASAAGGRRTAPPSASSTEAPAWNRASMTSPTKGGGTSGP